MSAWTFADDGPLRTLTLDHGELNLYDAEVEEGLFASIHALTADPPRAVLIRAEGRVWTGGVEVERFAGVSAEEGAELWRRQFDLMHELEDLPCPVIFAAHGLTLTWGLELALACDILLAAESARFGLVERVVGLTPSMGGPQRMAERAGPARAKHFIFTGEILPARTLEQWGVVTRVYADDEFAAKVHEVSMHIAEGPTRAHAATKAIVHAQKENGARAGDAVVPEVSGPLFATDDLRNAVQSFLRDGPGKATYSGR